MAARRHTTIQTATGTDQILTVTPLVDEVQ